MRKIDEQMSAAVARRINWGMGNTRVIINNSNGLEVRLHGFLIYQEKDGVKYFTLAGWDTLTTRTRLRALGVDIKRVGGKTYYDGSVVDKNEWYAV